MLEERRRNTSRISINVVKRGLNRYPGSKVREASTIISHMPEHRVYVEPCAGGAAVLLQKERARTEILNDKNAEVVNLLRVLADEEMSQSLKKRVEDTPYSRVVLEEAWAAFEKGAHRPEQVTWAHNFLVRCVMSQRGKGMLVNPGFDGRVNKDGFCGRVNYWAQYGAFVSHFRERLKGVLIERLDVLACLKAYDGENRLFYIDPPYTPKEWGGGVYPNEMSEEEHREMCAIMRSLKGYALISGYPNEIYYEELEAYGWVRVEKSVRTEGSKKTEALWLSPRTVEAKAREESQVRLL